MITNNTMKEYYSNGRKLTKDEMIAHLNAAIATVETTNSDDFTFQLQINYK